jgi:hypothetical protein
MKFALSLLGVGVVLWVQGVPGYLARHVPAIRRATSVTASSIAMWQRKRFFPTELLIVSTSLFSYLVRYPFECLKHLDSCE